MKILYGTIENFIDVTEICFSQLKYGSLIIIPENDFNRSTYFSDPHNGIVKKIMIIKDDLLSVYDEFTKIKIYTHDNSIITINEKEVLNKLKIIQEKIDFNYGCLNEELPEQKMALNYLTGKEKVLEIGSNIGRNSCVIASILEDSSNLVTLECNEEFIIQLKENRDKNNFKFQIENSALSKRKLITRGWETIPSEDLKEGFKWTNIISLDELKTKYNIDFDTLVLDCEGGFYFILSDMPEILDNINLIIMENDYWDINHKIYIDEILNKNNFTVDYIEIGGWGPCYNNFFEVWKKN
jgi:FkbM family methyltransferase